VTSQYHGSKILDLKQPFLKETTICTVERWEKSIAFRLPFFVFFPAIFVGPRFVKIQEFYYHGNMTQRFLLFMCFRVLN